MKRVAHALCRSDPPWRRGRPDLPLPRATAACVVALLAMAAPHPTLGATLSPETACPAQPELMPPREALPSLAAVLHPGGHVSILVVGSATVFGPEASLAPGTLTSRTLRVAPSAAAGTNGAAASPGAGARAEPVADHPSEASFPVRMKAALEARLPGLTVSLTVRGGRSLTAEDMLPLLRAGLDVPQRPQLVIWQTGTVDAVRNVSPGQFNQSLSDGTDAVIDASADLILIDPQFSRFLQANADLPPYFGALRNAAALPGVVLFPRFELMQSWSESGGGAAAPPAAGGAGPTGGCGPPVARVGRGGGGGAGAPGTPRSRGTRSNPSRPSTPASAPCWPR